MIVGHNRSSFVRRAGLAVLILALALGVWFAPIVGTALVVSRPLTGEPDAIVSLASHEWERLPAAAMFATRFPHAAVVLTQPEKVNGFNCHDCANRVRRLSLSGVAAERVRIVRLVEGGTYGEALAVRRLVAETGYKHVLVVTSPYHTRRSLATFTAALSPGGVEVGVEPATASSPSRPERWWSAPYDRAYVVYEWAGIVYYTLRFRMQ